MSNVLLKAFPVIPEIIYLVYQWAQVDRALLNISVLPRSNSR